MNTANNPLTEKREENQSANNQGKEQVQTSFPQTERPEGPFEHSGETAGWTKEEAEEKNQQEDGSNIDRS